MISNKTLAKVAVFGGFITISSGFYVNWKIQARVRSSEYFREAIKCVRTHPGAVKYLGEPIKVGQMDLGNTNVNFCDGYKAQFEVPVKGPNDKGTVYLWARKVEQQKAWEVYRLELGLKTDQNRRLIIRKEVTS